MTNYEFESQYKKLEETSPYYAKATVKELVAGCVFDLDQLWFKRLVERIILNPTQRIDIGEAARSEKQARRAVRDTRDLTEAYQSLKENISDDGLKKVLESLGAKSLMDAVKAAK